MVEREGGRKGGREGVEREGGRKGGRERGEERL